MTRIARRGSARRAQQLESAVKMLKTAARKYARATSELMNAAPGATDLELGRLSQMRCRAVDELEIAAAWFARIDGVVS